METFPISLSLLYRQDPANMLSLVVPVALATSAMAASVDMSVFGPRYPPKSNAFSSIEDLLKGSGAPGIYNSSSVPDGSYGVYNWCNMPHVRGQSRAILLTVKFALTSL